MTSGAQSRDTQIPSVVRPRAESRSLNSERPVYNYQAGVQAGQTGVRGSLRP